MAGVLPPDSIVNSSSLHFGLFLNAHDLMRAAGAYGKFLQNSLVLDLIINRRSHGIPILLKGDQNEEEEDPDDSPPQALFLTSLPLEILQFIKTELLQLFLEGETSPFDRCHLDFWDDYDFEGDSDIPIPPYPTTDEDKLWTEWESNREASFRRFKSDSRLWTDKMADYHGSSDCDDCNGADWSDDVIWDTDDDILNLRQLLRVYHLSLTSTNILNRRETWAPDYAFAVCLPTYSHEASLSPKLIPITSTESSTLKHEVLEPYSKPAQTAAVYCRSFFSPSSADHNRFRRFVNNFDIRIVDVDHKVVTRNTKRELDEEKRLKDDDENEKLRWKERVADEEKGEHEGAEEGKPSEPPFSPPKTIRPGFFLLHTSLCD